MTKRTFILSAFAYVLITFTLATLWHIVLFKDYYISTGMLEEPIPLFGLASILIQAAILPYIYSLFHKGINPVREGLLFGLLIALFLGSLGVIEAASRYDLGPLFFWFVYEGVFFILQFLLAGLVLGLIFGKRQLAAQTS